MSPGTRKCPYCAEFVRPDAIVCKHCGRDLEPVAASTTSGRTSKPADGPSPAVVIFAIVGVLASIGLINFVRGANSPATPSDGGPASTAPRQASSIEATSAPVPVDNWTYDDQDDKLSGSKSHTACSTSTNEVTVGFPYKSGPVRLCIRRAPRSGLNVFVQLVGTGQVLCTSYSGCSVPIRFDSAAPAHFGGAGPSDSSTDTVFLSPEAKLVSRIKSSKRIVVGLTLYQEGQQSIEWSTAGLKWP